MDSYSFLRFVLNFQLPNEIRCSQRKLKIEKTDIKHKKVLLDLQFVKTIMPFQSFYALKLLILICAPVPLTDDVKESFYRKRFTTKDLSANLKKNVNRYIIMLNLI